MKNNNRFFFIEEKHYSFIDLVDSLGDHCVDQLRRKKICEETPNGTIKFSFVGLISYHEKLIFVFPKYIKMKNEVELVNTMKTVIRVIRKYNKKFISTKDFLNFFDLSKEEYSTSFATAGYILDDYSRNGIYSKTESFLEFNGMGEINWDSTVNGILPIVSQGSPYYLDFITHNIYSDENNVVTRVHKWAIAHYSSIFGEWLGFTELFVEPENTKLDSIGTKEYLVAKLTNELNETFIDDKINLIKVLIDIVKEFYSLPSEQLNVYGTRNFELVWEEVCRLIFADEFDKYKEKIPAPLWTSFETGIAVKKDTFIPDIIKTYRLGKDEYFAILDAKYYNFRFTSNNVLGNPSVNDVSKQLLYQKAFSNFRKRKMRNYFLFPFDGETEEVLNVIGKVSLDFINPNPVFLVYLSAEKVYNMYLNNDILEGEYEQLENQTNRLAL